MGYGFLEMPMAKKILQHSKHAPFLPIFCRVMDDRAEDERTSQLHNLCN